MTVDEITKKNIDFLDNFLKRIIFHAIFGVQGRLRSLHSSTEPHLRSAPKTNYCSGILFCNDHFVRIFAHRVHSIEIHRPCMVVMYLIEMNCGLYLVGYRCD